MLTVLDPSSTLTKDALVALQARDGKSDAETDGQEHVAGSASGSATCYLIFFSSTLNTSLVDLWAHSGQEGEQQVPVQVELTEAKEMLWCPDCRNALEAILQVFSQQEGPHQKSLSSFSSPSSGTLSSSSHPRGYLLQVSREEWKSGQGGWHAYRREFDVQSVPTLLKIVEGVEVARLVDEECADVEMIWSLVRG